MWKKNEEGPTSGAAQSRRAWLALGVTQAKLNNATRLGRSYAVMQGLVWLIIE